MVNHLKTIIAGSRSVKDYATIERGMLSCPFRHDISVVLCGMCEGPDLLGKQWADIHRIPVKKYEPDWTQGAYMGMIRNHAMGDAADALVAFWDGKSKGTLDMIEYMRNMMKIVHVVRCYPNVFDQLTGAEQ